MTLRFAVSAMALSTTLLTACGGGGGGSDAGIPSTSSYPLATIYRNYQLATKDITATGIGSDGNRYTFRLVQQPLAAAVFPVTNATAGVFRQTVTLSGGGASSSTSVNNYYDSATGAPLGTYEPSTGACSRISSFSPLPAAANIGASGALTTELDLAACSTTAATLGTSDTRWSIEAARAADGSAFALICQNATVSATATSPSGAVSICLEVAADGSIGNRMRFSTRIAQTPLFELTATSY